MRRKKKRRLVQRLKDKKLNLPTKHLKPKGASYRFRTLETMLKNKQSRNKHMQQRARRVHDPKNFVMLRKELINVPILLIVRIHGYKNVPKSILLRLRNLRLFKISQCVIMRNTPELMRELNEVQPYVTFGIPSAEVIRELIMKRGQILNAQQNKRLWLKSNMVVEQSLGKWDCICIEDIIDVLKNNPYELPSSSSSSAAVAEKNNNNHNNHHQNSDNDSNENNKEKDKDNKHMNGDKKVDKKKSLLRIDAITMTKCEDTDKVKRFDTVCNAVNPFQLNNLKIPLRGLQTPFRKKGYWGYRGKHINKFVEKVI